MTRFPQHYYGQPVAYMNLCWVCLIAKIDCDKKPQICDKCLKTMCVKCGEPKEDNGESYCPDCD